MALSWYCDRGVEVVRYCTAITGAFVKVMMLSCCGGVLEFLFGVVVAEQAIPTQYSSTLSITIFSSSSSSSLLLAHLAGDAESVHGGEHGGVGRHVRVIGHPLEVSSR